MANRPVLIGLTSTGAHDTFPTVFGGAEMPGVEVHANVLDQLLASRWLVRAPSSAVLVGEGLTLVLIVLALVRRPTRLLLILGPLLGAIWFAAIVIAGTNRVIVEPLYPSLVLGLV